MYKPHPASTDVLADRGFCERAFEASMREALADEWDSCVTGSRIAVNGRPVARASPTGWVSCFSAKPLPWSKFVNHVRAAGWTSGQAGEGKRFTVERDERAVVDITLPRTDTWEVSDVVPFVRRAIMDSSYKDSFLWTVENKTRWGCDEKKMLCAVVRAYIGYDKVARQNEYKEPRPADEPVSLDIASANAIKAKTTFAWIEAMRAISPLSARLCVYVGGRRDTYANAMCACAWLGPTGPLGLAEVLSWFALPTCIDLRVHGVGDRTTCCSFDVCSATKDVHDVLFSSMPMTTEDIDARVAMIDLLDRHPPNKKPPGRAQLRDTLLFIRDLLLRSP